MTNAERAASARNNYNLVWAGQKASNVVPSVLDFRTELEVLDPASLGVSEAQAANFGEPLKGRTRGLVVAPNDGGGASLLDGCEPFPPNPAIAGNFVLMDRGTCTFAQKVLNAQNAGAVGAIIANNVSPGLPSMTGANPSILIPSVGITQALGASLRDVQPAFVALNRNPTNRAGTGGMNYPRLYAPTVYAAGSSVSHWDVTATPNILMEPFINSDLVASVKNPDDLSKSVLVDIGW